MNFLQLFHVFQTSFYDYNMILYQLEINVFVIKPIIPFMQDFYIRDFFSERVLLWNTYLMLTLSRSMLFCCVSNGITMLLFSFFNLSPLRPVSTSLLAASRSLKAFLLLL